MRKVFLDNLPKTNKGIDWKKSVGCKLKFIYDEIEDFLTIKNYIKSNDAKHNKLLIKYNDMEYKISPDEFKAASLGRICGKISSDFKINIGDNIIDNTRNLTIIDRKYELRRNSNGYITKIKKYKYHCNLCNSEKWDSESHILGGRSCACFRKSITLNGVNDIPTTAPWMIPYFQGGYDEAKLYTRQSSKRIIPKCPYCNRIHDKSISITSLYNSNGFRCLCSDKISYAEKFMICFLNQISIKFEYQKYSKELFNQQNYYYDFYLPEYNYIIETHGEQHYRKSCGFFNDNKFIVYNDNSKKHLALNHNIDKYIIIDCQKSNLNWIKNSILKSDLKQFINNSNNNVDWDRCELYAMSNMVKEVCDFKNEHTELTPLEISKFFPICRETITKYLHIGNKYGWCKYTGNSKNIVVSKDNEIIGIYKSAKELSDLSENDFGVKFSEGYIRTVCKKDKLYKGYKLEYCN